MLATPAHKLGLSFALALMVHAPAAYLVFDIQLLMGEGAVSISPDEYVFAALTLYLDVSPKLLPRRLAADCCSYVIMLLLLLRDHASM